MNGAELKVALQGFAVHPSWFARHMDVSLRTVRRWQDGDPIPPEVDKEIRKIDRIMRAAMEDQIALARSRPPGPISLYTFRTDAEYVEHGYYGPASWHRMVTHRSAEALRKKGYSVTIEYA